MKNHVKIEESYLFMWLLTFIGGYSNGYSYLTRDGAFVSFQTGNIAKVGLSVVMGNRDMLLSSLLPICAALLGAILAQLLKTIFSKKSVKFWQETALIIELAAFFIVGCLPKTCSNNAVVFFMAITTMFQLSNFRILNGSVHNTTIETGNLRTVGQYTGEFLWQRDWASLKKALYYFAVFIAFPLGVAAGGWISATIGAYAIWLCCVLLVALLLLFQKSKVMESEKAQAEMRIRAATPSKAF